MSLPIKDGTGTTTAFKSTLDGTDHVVHRNIDDMPATADSSGLPSIPAKVLMVGAQNPSSKCVPLSVDSSGYLNTATTITGGATETKQDTIITKLTEANVDHAANEVLLGTIAGDTTSLDTKITACNTGAVVLAAGSANVGDVDVASVAIPSAIYHGKKTVTAGTDEAIGASQAITSGVNVKALAGNSGLIYVGKVNVSSADGYELSAKESVFIECDNIATVYIDAASGSSDGITYIAS